MMLLNFGQKTQYLRLINHRKDFKPTKKYTINLQIDYNFRIFWLS